MFRSQFCPHSTFAYLQREKEIRKELVKLQILKLIRFNYIILFLAIWSENEFLVFLCVLSPTKPKWTHHRSNRNNTNSSTIFDHRRVFIVFVITSATQFNQVIVLKCHSNKQNIANSLFFFFFSMFVCYTPCARVRLRYSWSHVFSNSVSWRCAKIQFIYLCHPFFIKNLNYYYSSVVATLIMIPYRVSVRIIF